MMRIRLFGRFAIDVDGRDAGARPWRLRKAQTMVKMLALAPEQRMHRDQLLDLLWPDRTAAAAANNLHQALRVGRRELTGTSSPGQVLAFHDGLVLLHADGPVETDVLSFRRLAAQAWATRTLGDLAAAADAYTGELLPEDRFADWAGPERGDLRQTYCDLLIAHAAEATRHGETDAAARSLRRAIEADPVHEPAARAYMRLLAGQGRRSEALALYERLRTELGEDFGTDPDPASRLLYRDLLADSVDVAPSPRPSAGSNLQPGLTSFIGRERQVAEVRRELSRARLVTLTGPGGVGKTRLAEEAVRGLVDGYADGVWLVDLAPVTTPERLSDAVAEAMGLDPAAGADPVRALVARLATRHVLLLFDNCEQVVDACADLLRRLLVACPGLRALATSREALHVPGEVILRVPSLTVPMPAEPVAEALTREAVRLFVDRARLVRGDFRLDESTAAPVVRICQRLDGVPLAIELAAARLAHLTSVEIAERLGSALSVLSGTGRMTRHATLRATLEWSHSLLTVAEQVLLRRLSVFAGGFTVHAAEGVCAAPPLTPAMILDCLARLVDKSMVQVEPAADRTRYRLLETIRQFGHEQLRGAGEEAAVRAAHLGYFRRMAADHDPDRRRDVVEARPQLLDPDHDNLRAALDWSLWAEPDEALLLAVSLWRFWLARGHFVEGSRWLERTLAAAPRTSGAERSRALLGLAVLNARRGQSSRLAELGAAAVAEMERVGSPAEAAFTRVLAGFLQPVGGNVVAAAAIADRGLDEARSLDAPQVAAAAHWLRSLVALFREEAPAALTGLRHTLAAVDRVAPDAGPVLPAATSAVVLIPCGDTWVPAFEESALIGRQVGHAQAPGHIWSAIASAHRLDRDLASAVVAVRRAVAVFAGLGDDAGRALSLHQLGCIERDLGRFGDAREHLGDALRLRRRLGDCRGENLTLANLGMADAAAGDIAAGRRHGGIALRHGLEMEDAPGTAGSLLDLAVVELFAGDRARSRDLAGQAVAAMRPQGYPRLTGWALQFAAELAWAAGDRADAGRLGAEAATLFTAAGCRLGRARAGGLTAKSR
ncbi:BTAD domain-containing putative transcriptional regulator [Actinoplanes sp. NPDC023936]|uniref:ATP-binding protein n=1 Tax=Actinoplanes sp. NPDC023936 TaxID=3154910 RepID=UPI0033D741DE